MATVTAGARKARWGTLCAAGPTPSYETCKTGATALSAALPQTGGVAPATTTAVTAATGKPTTARHAVTRAPAGSKTGQRTIWRGGAVSFRQTFTNTTYSLFRTAT